MEEKREEKQDKSGALTGKSSPLLPKARSWVAMNESPPSSLPFPGVLGYMASIGSLVIFYSFSRVLVLLREKYELFAES